jgi:hypothetical protein
VATKARTTSNSVIMAPSEALGPQQGVSQIEQQAERDEAGKRIIEDHGSAPLQTFAGIGVADARHEEAEGERQHDDVQHGMFLCDMNCEPKLRLSRLPD